MGPNSFFRKLPVSFIVLNSRWDGETFLVVKAVVPCLMNICYKPDTPRALEGSNVERDDYKLVPQSCTALTWDPLLVCVSSRCPPPPAPPGELRMERKEYTRDSSREVCLQLLRNFGNIRIQGVLRRQLPLFSPVQPSANPSLLLWRPTERLRTHACTIPMGESLYPWLIGRLQGLHIVLKIGLGVLCQNSEIQVITVTLAFHSPTYF